MGCCEGKKPAVVLSDEQFESMFFLKDLLDLIGQFRKIDEIGFNVDTVKAIVKLLKSLAGLTNTEVDDKLVDFLDKVVADENVLDTIRKLLDWFGVVNDGDNGSDEVVVV